MLSQSVLQTIERYYLVLAVMLKEGSGTLRQRELENACQQVAERMAMLYELSAPEFFDKRLFAGFIDHLREVGFVWTNDDGCIAFDERVDAVEQDARQVLSDRIRHSILQVTHA